MDEDDDGPAKRCRECWNMWVACTCRRYGPVEPHDLPRACLYCGTLTPPHPVDGYVCDPCGEAIWASGYA